MLRAACSSALDASWVPMGCCFSTVHSARAVYTPVQATPPSMPTCKLATQTGESATWTTWQHWPPSTDYPPANGSPCQRTISPLYSPASEELILRPRQTQVLAQRHASISLAKDPPPPQFRNHKLHEVIQPFRHRREHDIETVTSASFKPRLHRIGDLDGRSYNFQPAKSTHHLR